MGKSAIFFVVVEGVEGCDADGDVLWLDAEVLGDGVGVYEVAGVESVLGVEEIFYFGEGVDNFFGEAAREEGGAGAAEAVFCGE